MATPARPDDKVIPGHGTEALGPSDTSDSGSDVRGGPGRAAEVDAGTEAGRERERAAVTGEYEAESAGADLGDADLDSDSDAAGTGERAAAGRDVPPDAPTDIAPDHVADETIADASEDIDDYLSEQERQQKKVRGA